MLICIYVLCDTLCMLSQDQKARAYRAATACRALGITQAEIAAAVGASQPQVSRIFTAKALRTSRLFEEVCLYVERRNTGITADAVRANQELVEALQTTWNGSAAHARSLATVIRSLAGFGTSPISPPIHQAEKKC